MKDMPPITDPNRDYVVALVKSLGEIRTEIKDLKDAQKPTNISINVDRSLVDEAVKETVTKDLIQEHVTNGVDGVSITDSKLNDNGELILSFSNGEEKNVGVIKGIDGTDGIDAEFDEEALIAKILSLVPKPEVVDEARLLKTFLESVPKEKQITTQEVILKIKNGKEISYEDIRNLPNLSELIKKYTAHLENKGATMIAGGGAMSRMLDVDLTGLQTGYTLVWNGSKWTPQAGGTGGGHTIQDEGTPLTARANLNFVGAGVTVTDGGAGPNSTIVTIPGGGTTPTGTGFTHITGGVQDAASKLVDTADINNSQVTLAKQADVATSTVFYRKTAGTGAPEVNTLATLKTDLGLTGTNTGDQTITLTGDVTGSGTGSFATTIANNAVSNAKLATAPASTIKGNNTGGVANVADMTVAQTKTLLAIVSADISDFATTVRSTVLTGLSLVSTTVISATDTILVALGSLQAQITALTTTVGTKVASVGATSPITSSGGTTPTISTSMNTSKLIGRGTAGVGVMEEITVGTGLSFSGTTLNSTGGTTYNLGSLVYADGSVPAGNTVANTVTETALTSSYTIPALGLSVGDVIRIRVSGLYSTDIVAPNITAKVKIGSVVVATTGSITAVAAVTNGGYTGFLDLIVTNAGASGVVESQGFLEFATAATTALTVNLKNTAAISAIDFTTSQTITVTIQWGTANAANTLTMRQMEVDINKIAATAGLGITRTIASVATNTTALAVSNVDYVYLCSTAMTLTLPTAVGNKNLYTVKNTGSGNVTVATSLSQTIDGGATAVLTASLQGSVDIVSDNSNWSVV